MMLITDFWLRAVRMVHDGWLVTSPVSLLTFLHKCAFRSFDMDDDILNHVQFGQRRKKVSSLGAKGQKDHLMACSPISSEKVVE